MSDEAFAAALAASAPKRRAHRRRRALWLVALVAVFALSVAAPFLGYVGSRLAFALAVAFCSHRAWVHHHRGSIALNLQPSSLTAAEEAALYGPKAYLEGADRRR